MAENIIHLLQKERENEETLKKEYRKLEEEIKVVTEQLLRIEGKIEAYEDLLKVTGSDDRFGDVDNFSNYSRNNESEFPKKSRASRATKKEMERRYNIVGRIFIEQGDISVKELEPLLDEALGYHLEAHQQRAILYRYPNEFQPKEEHGIWGLSENGRTYFSSLKFDSEDIE
jgi:hypothetical protein